MRYIQAAAAFMICLVLSLPFYSSSVFAQTTGLTNVNVKGSDGYEGFVRNRDDTFTFSARTCISEGIEVKKEQVRLWGASNSTGFAFGSCAAVGDGCSYDCAFSRTMSDYSNICPSYDFDINLYKDGAWFDDKEAESVCDTKAPFINVNLDSQDPTNYKKGSNVTFIYFVTDKACDTCSGKCVGIKNVVFKAAGYEKNIDINTGQNICSYNSVLKEPASSFKEGTVDISATAYDYFGQNYTKTLSFAADFTSPKIILNSFEIKKTDGTNINYFMAQNVKLNIILNVTDETEIDSTSVVADLSSIGGSSSATTTCDVINSRSLQCSYSNIEYYLNTSSFSKTITVNASDTAGNSKKQSITLSKGLAVDSTAPSISGLRLVNATSGAEIKDKWLGGSSFNARVYINITEAEIGLDQSTVYANLLELNPLETSYANKPKDSCETLTGNITRCWFDITVDVNSSGGVNKNIVFNASDLAGNTATTTLTLSNVFKKDSEKPVISGLRLINSSGAEIKDKWLGGESFSAYVYVNITEAGIGLDQNTVYANLLELNPEQSSYSKKEKTSCSPINANITSCWFDINVDVNSSGNVDKSLVFNASDLAGNEAETTLVLSNVFKKDSEKPIISGLIITDTNGNETKGWIKGDNLSVFIYINITETGIGLDNSSVYANISELNPSESSYSNKAKDDCVQKDDNATTCRFSAVLNINESGTVTKSLIFKAADKAGNAKSQQFSYEFKIDRTGPEFQLIRTNRSDPEGRYWLGDGANTIIAEIKEEGIGLEKHNVSLDLSSILLGSNVQADNCTAAGSIWHCYWHNIITNAVSGNYTISSTLSSKDDIGNAANKTIQGNISIDKIRPEIINVKYSPSYPTKGDILVFSVNLSENLSGLKQVKIDVAPIRNNTNGSFFVAADYSDCEKEGNNYLCEIEFDNIIDLYVEASLNLTAEDFAGNMGNGTVDIIIYKADAEAVPDFFKIEKIEAIPPSIDRLVASQMPLKQFLHVFLVKNNAADDVSILSKEVSCNTSSGYVSSYYLFNEDADDPYITLMLSTSVGEIEESTFSPDCQLLLRVAANETLYKNAEIENITKEITLYNNPLGQLDDNIKAKLDGVNSRINEIEDEISNKEKWISTFGTYCSIAQMMGTINNILQSLKPAIAALGCELKEFGGDAIWQAYCTVASLFHKIVENFIWPSGFPSPLAYVGWMLKVSCMVLFNCMLCDADQLVFFAGSIGINAVSINNFNSKKIIVASSFEVNYNYMAPYVISQPTTEQELDFLKNSLKENKEPASLSKITGKAANDGGNKEQPKWAATGIPTKVTDDSSWIFNPYLSKHYAAACLCLPAMVYNLKKEKQINCMYRNCLTNHLGTGTSSTVCDFAYKERECLYVESAQFKKHGYMSDFFESIATAILKALPFLAAAAAFKLYCSKYYSSFACTGNACADLNSPTGPVWCGVLGGAMALSEIIFGAITGNKFSFNNYDQDLKGEDYCSTGGALE